MWGQERRLREVATGPGILGAGKTDGGAENGVQGICREWERRERRGE